MIEKKESSDPRKRGLSYKIDHNQHNQVSFSGLQLAVN